MQNEMATGMKRKGLQERKGSKKEEEQAMRMAGIIACTFAVMLAGSAHRLLTAVNPDSESDNSSSAKVCDNFGTAVDVDSTLNESAAGAALGQVEREPISVSDVNVRMILETVCSNDPSRSSANHADDEINNCNAPLPLLAYDCDFGHGRITYPVGTTTEIYVHEYSTYTRHAIRSCLCFACLS